MTSASLTIRISGEIAEQRAAGLTEKLTNTLFPNKSLQELQDDLNAGRLRWGELANKGTRLFSKTKPGEMMKKIEAVGKTSMIIQH